MLSRRRRGGKNESFVLCFARTGKRRRRSANRQLAPPFSSAPFSFFPVGEMLFFPSGDFPLQFCFDFLSYGKANTKKMGENGEQSPYSNQTTPYSTPKLTFFSNNNADDSNDKKTVFLF